ncbi:hypothetical protein HNO52_03160 [Billgrantia diversa]|uniref:hypothetical protein n=1 Tax=Halomonas sp. MCCC 1A13316 TaxID=2733487 RepID=UPI0018A404EC|nr:hypothetical protein [Halomonas sp. MCCC 1A13316]QOR37629.1 hypothetical protein HNO52_03160 [Halomonas sp. MCCC 1A13316]
MNVYFSDYFSVSKDDLEEYGAFNVSLINDLPVFIDPFLLFNSDKPEYQHLHDEIIKYIGFLRDMSEAGTISKGLVRHWFLFPEVRQNWLGFSKVGNGGSGLGPDFANALNENLSNIFNDFGSEKITKSSHLEKLCLIKEGVGKDSISDFTTNLIKSYLCEYTQDFSQKYIDSSRTKSVMVPHAEFNYKTRRWTSKKYTLPYIDGDYVLLTPKDILTKDEAWINKHDIIGDFDDIVAAIPNVELRDQVNDYFLRRVPEDAKQREINEAIAKTLRNFPELIDRYIRLKEDTGDQAVALSEQKVHEIETVFIRQVASLIESLKDESSFYETSDDTHDEAYNRVLFLKQVIENNDGYRIFYSNGQPIKRESDLQLMFRLTWYASQDDVNAEVNNGRGPVDYKISRGSKDSTLVEFKLASNSKLKQNLAKQVEVYKAANETKKSIKVILYFSDSELFRVQKIMKELELKEGKELVLIDAQATNKPSGSNAR